MPLQRERLGEVPLDALGHAGRVARLADGMQDDHELVAAQADDGVQGTQRLELARTLLLSISMLRREDSMELLLEQVEEAPFQRARYTLVGDPPV